MADWDCAQIIPGVAGGETQVPTIKCFEEIFSRILQVIVAISFIALFIMFLIGGFRLLTSGGDPKASAQAKQTLTYALIGILLMAGAFIVFRILEAFTGVPLTIFEIPQLDPSTIPP